MRCQKPWVQSDCLRNSGDARESLPNFRRRDNPRVERLLVTQMALQHLAGHRRNDFQSSGHILRRTTHTHRSSHCRCNCLVQQRRLIKSTHGSHPARQCRDCCRRDQSTESRELRLSLRPGRSQQIVHRSVGALGRTQPRPDLCKVLTYLFAGAWNVGCLACLQLRGNYTFLPVPLLFDGRKWTRTVHLVALEHRMPTGHMDPELRGRIVCTVTSSGDRFDARGLSMNRHEMVGQGHRRPPVGGRDSQEVCQCSVESPRWITVDTTHICHRRGKEGVEVLEHHRPLEADQCCRRGPDLPTG